jgi:hypothetical protein
MKNLEMSEMENFIGGTCDGVLEQAGFGLAGSGLIFSASAVFVAATPVGWMFLGFAAISFYVAALSCE